MELPLVQRNAAVCQGSTEPQWEEEGERERGITADGPQNRGLLWKNPESGSPPVRPLAPQLPRQVPGTFYLRLLWQPHGG